MEFGQESTLSCTLAFPLKVLLFAKALCGRATKFRGAVAQWLEQGTHNPSVVGSIPTGPTNALLLKRRRRHQC
jgi:hypothetical protein